MRDASYFAKKPDMSESPKTPLCPPLPAFIVYSRVLRPPMLVRQPFPAEWNQHRHPGADPGMTSLCLRDTIGLAFELLARPEQARAG